MVVDGAGVLLEEHAELVMVSGAHPGALTQLHALLCPVLVIEFPAGPGLEAVDDEVEDPFRPGLAAAFRIDPPQHAELQQDVLGVEPLS